MPEENVNAPNLTVTLERTGGQLRGIKSYRLQSAYTVSADAFSFEAVESLERRSELFGLELEPVELEIDGVSQGFGRIEVSKPGAGLARQFMGRDYIAEMVECHVDPGFKIEDGHTVAAAITLAAGPVGITTVQSDGDVALRNVRTGKAITGGAPPDYRSTKIGSFKAKPGEGIYELCNRIAARHHSFIQPALDRATVCLTSPNYDQSPSHRIVRRIDGRSNNVLQASATRDYSSFPTIVISTARVGQAAKTRTPTSRQVKTADPKSYHPLRGSPSVLNVSDLPTAGAPLSRSDKDSGTRNVDVNAFAGSGYSDELERTLDGKIVSERIKFGQSLDDPRQLYRLHTYHDEQARSSSQLDSSTLRRLAEMMKPTLIYSVTVHGHRDPVSGALWAVDTIAEVEDEIEGVNEALWCVSRTFAYSSESGRTTELEYWRPSTYQV